MRRYLNLIQLEDHGKYVLILGARKPASKKKPTGRLVYFESEDLKDWNFKGDYWANNEFNMIEMPDIFEIDGTWYLLFSEYCEDKKTKYRVGAGLFSDWKSPVDEAFDGKAYYAARTVGTNETGRFLTGWVATKEGENDQNNWDWGGALVPHQIIQKTDKTLCISRRFFKNFFNYFYVCNSLFHIKNSSFLVRFDGVLECFFTILRGTVVVVLILREKGDGVGS
ncbi:hypothetical protein EfmAA96_18540 [Enterococcus faecium]|nr:hypothetical protein EfmAA96_18540 [Enterococcus faecium]